MSMYLHSLVRWYFDGGPKAAAPTELRPRASMKRWGRGGADAPGQEDTWTREPEGTYPGRVVASPAPHRAALEPVATLGKTGVVHLGLPPGVLERHAAPQGDERCDATPTTPRLPAATELAPLPAPASLPLRYMLSPHQLGLDDPRLLQAYDAHFDEQGDHLFAADGCVLTAEFFVDVGLLDRPAQAQRLAEALWPETAGPEVFRALAYVELPALQRRVAAAAQRAEVHLDADAVVRTARLLRLHGLEACRIELYTQLLLECQEHSRQFSRFFRPQDVASARGLLAEVSLTEVADQFLGEDDAPPASGPVFTHEVALAAFYNEVRSFCAWLQEARVYPSKRGMGPFYPESPAYEARSSEAAPPPYHG